jgi:hypothetical protein
MSFLSESLTIGLLLAIVFGALCFYIYSRVSYVEKRVGLMENLILDIKVQNEQMPQNHLPFVPPNVTFQQVIEEPIQHHQEHVIKPMPDDEDNSVIISEVLPSENNEEVYSQLLNEVNETSHDDYENKTKEELIQIAKDKGIRISNRPGREKLLTLIRNSEKAVGTLQEASVESDA